ncbi:MAG: nitroreductase [Oscillospiraceae bacterium]|nr:nitroreductase [Oscillospiraceae bacterium]
MDNRYYKQIFRRRSFHRFPQNEGPGLTQQELDDIETAYGSFEPLYPGIRTKIHIVPQSSISGRRGGEYCILMYSEKKDGYLQNAGYLGEQLDLWLVSRNIGSLWLGLGKTEEKKSDGLDYVIMFLIGKADPSQFRADMSDAKRRPVDKIWEGDTLGIAETVRYAPSAVNSQPWYVVNNGQELTVCRYVAPGMRIIPTPLVSFYNLIDMGIFLLILEVCLAEKGIRYERELFYDAGGRTELNKTAVYKLLS